MTKRLSFDDVIRFMGSVPFNRMLEIRVDALDDGFARLVLPYKASFIGDPDRHALHGGVISTLIDTCGGAAVCTQMEHGDRLSTVDLRVDYLRPGQPSDLIAEARILRTGNRVGVTDIIAFHGNGQEKPIATGKAVYNIRRG